MATVSDLFTPEPEQWGLRGDPYVWSEMAAILSCIDLPDSKYALVALLKETFRQLVGSSITTSEPTIFVARLDHGGMSSGHISIEFWQQIAIPLLCKRHAKANRLSSGDQTDIKTVKKLASHIDQFIAAVGNADIEVYNEFSLQHELGFFLRNQLPNSRVRFERNVSSFGLEQTAFEKREIDIVICRAKSDVPICAIELKYPRNGQVPESMFSFCKDIAFLEQLVTSGFESAYFLAVVEHRHFYSGGYSGIYSYFRAGAPITGKIVKPTGAKDHHVTINGTYKAQWLPIRGDTKFCLVQIRS